MLTGSTPNYLLADGAAELERLRLQALVWEPEVEAMLDRIGLLPGSSCLDVGCGAVGILGPLSRRVGASGRVVGIDTDRNLLEAARAFVRELGLANVEVLERDAYATGLPRASFDLVHVRFLFAPLGRDEDLLRELLALTGPGGTVAVEETDLSPWNCFPPHPAWSRLKGAIAEAFARAGGDANAGRRTYGMLRRAGLDQVQIRAAVIGLPGGHPYLRLPIQFASSLRERILKNGLLTMPELDEAMAACEKVAQDPDTFGITFLVTQVWGRVPQR
jgi:SAM-dependent methyltransferase